MLFGNRRRREQLAAMSDLQVLKVAGEQYRTLPMFEELDRLMDRVRQRAFELFEQRGCECGHELEDWLQAERETLPGPAAEMLDRGKEIEIQMNLPGYQADEIEVAATGHGIVVHAEPKHIDSEPRVVLWSEFGNHGNVYRDFELSPAVDLDHVTARLENGILHITAPKRSVAEESAEVTAA
jgi:HSP20 family protein